MNILTDIDNLIYSEEGINNIISDLKKTGIHKDTSIIDNKKYKEAQSKRKKQEAEVRKAGIPLDSIKTRIKKEISKGEGFSVIPRLFNEIWAEMKKTGIVESIAIGAFVTYVVVFLNTALDLFLRDSGIDPKIAFFISMTVVPALVEETAKFMASKYKFTGGFMVAFNVAEFYLYVSSGAGIASRLIAVISHFGDALIHKHFRNLSNEYKKESFSVLGLVITGIMHALWNAMAIQGADPAEFGF
jgi:hypothetical protein